MATRHGLSNDQNQIASTIWKRPQSGAIVSDRVSKSTSKTEKQALVLWPFFLIALSVGRMAPICRALINNKS